MRDGEMDGGGVENRGNSGKGERWRRGKWRRVGEWAEGEDRGREKGGREEKGTPALLFMSFMEESRFPDEGKLGMVKFVCTSFSPRKLTIRLVH